MTDPIPQVPQEWHRLFSAALDDRLSETEAAQVQELLKTHADARRLWFLYHDNECTLGELKAPALNLSLTVQPGPSRRALRLRPWLSMAAGLMIGLVTAQALYSAVDFGLRRVLTILEESFESGPAPRVTGMPLEPGVWSGDFSAVTGVQETVSPEDGTHMLRFLRADYEGKPHPQGSYTADVYRLIDLRAHRAEFADGAGVLHVSAGFNAVAFPSHERYGASIGVYALPAGVFTSAEALRQAISTRDGSLAMAEKTVRAIDRDPRTWERFGVELRPPAEAEFLLIRLGMIHATPGQRRDTFDGHYLDEIRITLVRREPAS